MNDFAEGISDFSDLGIKWGWPKLTIGKFKLHLKPPRAVREAVKKITTPTPTPGTPGYTPEYPEPTTSSMMGGLGGNKMLIFLLIIGLGAGGFYFYKKRKKR